MKWSVEGKLAALFITVLVIGGAMGAVLARKFDNVLLGAALAAAIGLLPVLWLTRQATRPLRKVLRAMSGAVASFRDGDFSISLSANRKDELGELLAAHNELGHALREQRSQLAQRELLLETVTQNSPVALVLVDSHERVAYA